VGKDGSLEISLKEVYSIVKGKRLFRVYTAYF